MTTKTGKHLISNHSWDRYKNHIKRFLNLDAGRQTIVWCKHINQMLSHGEDTIPAYCRVEMEALCTYNAFRNWPLNTPSISGEADEENCSILVSMDYLKNLEGGRYLRTVGNSGVDTYWDLNWQEDRFIINGLTYRSSGDTQLAQAKDEALVFMVILKRDREAVINFVKLEDVNGFAGSDGIYFSGKDGEMFAGSKYGYYLGKDLEVFAGSDGINFVGNDL